MLKLLSPLDPIKYQYTFYFLVLFERDLSHESAAPFWLLVRLHNVNTSARSVHKALERDVQRQIFLKAVEFLI